MPRAKAGRRRGAAPSSGHNISDQLREIIRSRNLSGYAVGQLADVSPGVVARFLGRQRSLSLDSVDRIARGLGLRLVEVQTRRRPVRPGRDIPGAGPEAGAIPADDAGLAEAEGGTVTEMTLEALITDLGQCEAAAANGCRRPVPRSPDLLRWTTVEDQVGQLEGLTRDRLGRELDREVIVEWLQPRLGRLGFRGDQVTIGQALEAFDRVAAMPSIICGFCGGPLEEWRNAYYDCDACRRGRKEAYQATMAPLLIKASHRYAWGDLLAEVGPEVRDSIRVIFAPQPLDKERWDEAVERAIRKLELGPGGLANLDRSAFRSFLTTEAKEVERGLITFEGARLYTGVTASCLSKWRSQGKIQTNGEVRRERKIVLRSLIEFMELRENSHR